MTINFSKSIDKKIIVSLVEPHISKEIIKAACKELREHNYYSVIVDYYYLDLVKKLRNQKRIGTIISYPLGGMTTEIKIRLAEIAIKKGCSEIDICPRYNDFKTGNYKVVQKDIESVSETVKKRLDIVIILQVGSMTLREIKDICDISLRAGINIFRTNSNMETNPYLDLGTTELEHILFLKRVFGNDIEIEASGNDIKSRKDIEDFINAGADRVHYRSYIKELTEG